MRFRAISLATRITFVAVLLVVAGGLFWIHNEDQRLHQAFLSERSADLEAALHVEKARLVQSIDELRRDALFLANTPPIFGIVRAGNNQGLDPRDKNSYATWEARLQEIFAAFLRAHPDYSHARLIGVANGGRELVRVNSFEGQILVVQQGGLQAKGDRDFFKAGLALSVGRVHLSAFDLEQEWGKVEEPHRPTLRAVTPVFDASGNVFGMVVLNLDVRPLFAASAVALPPGVKGYIADRMGHYLRHPDAQRAFGFELGDKGGMVDDFPSTKPMFESQSQSYMSLHEENGGLGGYLAAERAFFDAGDPARFLVLAYHIPPEVLAKQSKGLSFPSLMDTFLVMIVAIVLFMMILRYIFAPLKRISASARDIASGSRDIRLVESGSGEIGELAVALNTMLDKLTDSELVKQENEFRKSVVETTHDGYWLVDALGNLIEVNQAYANMLGYTMEELRGKHISHLEAKERSADEVMAHVVKIIEQGSDVFETRHRHKDGREIDVEVSATFLPDAQKFVVFCRDITERRQAQLILQRHKQVIETAIDGFWMTNLDGYLEEVNEAYAKMSGYTMQELVGMHISQLEANEKPEEVKAHIDKLLMQGYDRFETKHRRKDGRIIDIEVATTYMSADQKFFVFSHNITRRKHAEQELRVAAAAFEAHDAILITDEKSNIVRVNRAFTEITGYRPEEVLGKNPRIMSSGRHDRDFYLKMWQELLHVGSWSGEIWDRRKNGDVYPKWMTISAVRTESGEITQYVAIFSDITERKRIEEEIHNLAFYDPLTQLPNRRLFLERMRSALPASARRRDFGALLFLDMDRFKILNDTMGHDCGDLMLIEVASRIKSCVREMDTVARLGGDEFVVLIEEVSKDEVDAARKVSMVAEKIREVLARPYAIKGHEHHSSPSIGIALYNGNEESMEVLLQHADLAMYQAKNSGRNAVCFFDPAVQGNTERHDALEKDLHHAVQLGELRLFYQVQVDGEQQPVGAEALLRWENPAHGLLLPDQFIPIAEESALIIEIGGWVLNEACAQLARWRGNEHMQGLTLTVNISARQFTRSDFVEQVAAIIARHQVEPERLKLELTQSLVVSDLAETVEKVRALRLLGVNLTLDDFGAVYSALHYLRQLSSEQLKIHREVVQGVTKDGADAQLVQAIVELAKNMQLDVFAEGVETDEQLAFLKQHACKAYQGYLFGKPVALDDFEKLLEQWKRA